MDKSSFTQSLRKFFLKIQDFFSFHQILIAFSLMVLSLSFLTYFVGYDRPQAPFWDESYHIASAEKYLKGTFFMEPHPPLGKLFIALGEKLFNQNDVDSQRLSDAFKTEIAKESNPNNKIEDYKDTEENRQKLEQKKLDFVKGVEGFTKTDYIDKYPENYSFTGVRFFPSLFAWFSAVIIFWIFVLILKNYLYALIFSGLYIFDNALIVHSRSAMLDSTQIFFILLSILSFLWVWSSQMKQISWKWYLALGLLSGLVVSIKVNGLIVVLLSLFWVGKEIYAWLDPEDTRTKVKLFWSLFGKITLFFTSLAFVYLGVFAIHFSLGKNIINDRIYSASSAYEEALKNGNPNFFGPLFVTAMKDSLQYSKQYNEGVPELDVCKPEENGSYPIGWILGAKSINYRWAKSENLAQYLYLQSNPFVWLVGLSGVLFGLVIILGKYVFRLQLADKSSFQIVGIFMLLYIGYMLAILQIQRVMYLYHYLIPLIFSFIIAAGVFSFVSKQYQDHPKHVWFTRVLIFYGFLIFISFLFFSPLTYYFPITHDQFMQRNWISWWQLKPVN